MFKLKSFLKVLIEPGPFAALVVATTLLIGIVGPASAQFFNFGGPPGPPRPSRGLGGWFGNDFFTPFQPQAPRRVQQDYFPAPPPDKRDSVPQRNVLGLGDGMAGWLPPRPWGAPFQKPPQGGIPQHKTLARPI